MTARALVRWLLIGRRKGVRARMRRALGVFDWLDREPEREPAPSAEARTGGAPAAPPATEVRSAPAPAPEAVPGEGWVRVLEIADLRPGELTEVLVGDRPVVLANVAGAVFAVDGTCPHAGGPLGDGVLEGPVLTCPWHGWSWDVTTGRSLVDQSQRVDTLPVTTSHGGIWVRSV